MWHGTMRHDRLVGVPFGESPVLPRGPDGQSARKEPACRVTSRTDKATRADGGQNDMFRRKAGSDKGSVVELRVPQVFVRK